MSAGPEEDLVAGQRDLDHVGAVLGDQPAELAHRPRRDVRLELAAGARSRARCA